jgi:hypothetical protein
MEVKTRMLQGDKAKEKDTMDMKSVVKEWNQTATRMM